MSEQNHTPTRHTRTSTRKHGKRLTAKERTAAQHTFLTAFKLNGNIMLSCIRANIDRSTFYQWLEHDASFSVQYHQAEKDFADLALAEFVKRATTGYEKPLVSMGKLVYGENGKPMTERVVSDTLLAMLIKRHFPEFREKQQIDAKVEHSGNVDTNTTLAVDLTTLSREQLRAMKDVLAREDG